MRPPYQKLVLALLVTFHSYSLLAQSGPTITGISPTTAVAGQQVAITGAGFGASGGRVYLGTDWAAGVVSWTDTKVVATVAGDAKSGPVYVVTQGAAQSNQVNLTITVPVIAAISPTTAVAGQQITITGSGFGSSVGQVFLGTAFAAATVSWSDTQVVATVNSRAHSGTVYVWTQGGAQSNQLSFLVMTPVIASVNPNPAVAGQPVTITGSGFGSGPGRAFLGTAWAANIVSWSDTQVVATVADGSQPGTVYIVSAAGVQSNQIDAPASQ